MFIKKQFIIVLKALSAQEGEILLYLIFPFSRWLLWLNTSSRACSSAWLERIPDKDEAGGSSPPRPTISTIESGGISSAGRAPALQAGGQRFDPAILHQAWIFGAWGNGQVILKGWPVYYSIIGF